MERESTHPKVSGNDQPELVRVSLGSGSHLDLTRRRTRSCDQPAVGISSAHPVRCSVGSAERTMAL